MRILILALGVMLFFWPAQAEELVVPPVDQASQDPSFATYRRALLNAVQARDTQTVLTLTSPDIALSFGGSEGHDAFARALNTPITSENRNQAKGRDLWVELETVLRMGGRFRDGDFVAPYTWMAPYPDDVDPYDVYYVTGKNVVLRSDANSGAKKLGHVSYTVVTLHPWAKGAQYQRVDLHDGTTGYLASAYLRYLLHYRATFSKTDKGWKLISFLDGN